MRRLLIVALCALLAVGCGRMPRKPDLPNAGTAVRPVVVPIDRVRFVSVPASMTEPEPIAEGPLQICPDVAAQRRAALKRANAKLHAIGEIQGTPVPDAGAK